MGKDVKVDLQKEPVILKSVSIGISEGKILLAFNCDDKNVPEYACVIPADKLKDLIGVLYESGKSYEGEYGHKIGFSTEE